MNRAELSFSFAAVIGRAKCALVGDMTLARQYLQDLMSYIAEREVEEKPIDLWSYRELVEAVEYLRYNKHWILDGDDLFAKLLEAVEIVDRHKAFLRLHDLLPQYLAA